jgi:hypothetical protein
MQACIIMIHHMAAASLAAFIWNGVALREVQ